ncbi:(2Fe-2S)-binding protein [Streptomyces calidiresistens]|uniref:Iron-sulfur protein n=1 Tax=Streptomyces calidiresistens TaxID=1485586 RepID=A0A7W3XWC9_9ACTN|nr:(2Fe-2S)-binding protein [Streptomyces calidiresistens]MBB0229718.1 iron-sulfur protein [Streptomyces calidiresistens]
MLSALAPTSPLAPAWERMGEVLPAFRVREEGLSPAAPAGDRWNPGELAAGGAALDAFLAREAERVERDYGAPARPDVVAGFALHRLMWSSAALFTVPWFLLRRVPILAPADILLDDTGLTVRVRHFHCLVDDPAAELPGARPVRDAEALRAALRSVAAEHFAPLLTTFGPLMRRRERALWGMASDELTESLTYLGGLFGEEERARREIELLLPGSTAPYTGGAGFRELTDARGRRHTTRDRISCCLFYTIRPEDTCLTCPRTCDAERVERLSGIR